MDRLKSLRSHNYQQLRKSKPDRHDDHNDDDVGGGGNSEQRAMYHQDNRDFVVSIDDNANRVRSNSSIRRGENDEGVALAERRATSLPITNGFMPKALPSTASVSGRRGDQEAEPADKKVVQARGIWRECSYDFLGDAEVDSWEKKAQAEAKRDRRGTSFDFGVPVDPPSRLIGNFLQMQKQSGGNSLDMDFDLVEFTDAAGLAGWSPGLESRQLTPLAEASESMRDHLESTTGAASKGRFPRLDSTNLQHLPSPPSSSSSSVSTLSPLSTSPSSSASISMSMSMSDSVRENGVGIEDMAQKSQFAEPFVSPSAPLPTIQLHEAVRPSGSYSTDSPRGLRDDSPPGSAGRDGLRSRRPTSRSPEATSDKVGSAAEEEIIKSPKTRDTQTFSRMKSRLAEPPIPREPLRSGMMAGGNHRGRSGQLRSQQLRSGIIGRTGFLGKVTEEEEDPFKDVDLPEKFKGNKWGWIVCLEWIALIVLAGGLVCSTVIPRLREVTVWGLELWKWVTLVVVVVCGRLLSDWIIRIVVFFIERNFLLRKRVLYFVYALRRGVQNCMWLAFVLVAWHLMFRARAQQATTALVYITKVLQCFLLGAALVVVKTFLVKVLASSFHMGTYFERIRDSLFNQYVLETLSGPPAIELQQIVNDQKAIDAEVAGLRKAGAFAPGLTDHVNSGRKSDSRPRSGIISRAEDPNTDAVMTIDKLNKLSQKNISAWNMKRLINLVKHTGVATLTHNFDDQVYSSAVSSETEITSEHEAKIAAKQVFHNVTKPGRKYISEEDLLRFMGPNEVARALPLFDGALETGKITPQALKSYVINVYRERRALALSLSDTKTAVNKLHRIINVVLTLVVIVIWLLILGIATTQLLVFVSSQMLLVVFVFGNTCKTVFEAIIFLFVMHPFDVGDRCLIDGVQMVVEEMNILTTVFIGDFGAKLWYPNSVLATKPIQNFYRSPDMGDSFEFIVHSSTPAEKIAQLKDRIGKYIAAKPHHWKSAFSMLVLDLVEVNKMKLCLGLSHTMNHQDFGEKVSRRSDLLWEMKKLFEELNIEYHLPTQEVHIRDLDKTTKTA